MFYLFLAAILSLFSLLFVMGNREGISNMEKFILFLCFWLIAGLAFETGVDWRVYKMIYDNALPINEVTFHSGFWNYTTGIEPGYGLISSILKTFTDEYQYLQIILLLIASILFFKSLKIYTTNYYLVLLLYFGYVYFTLNMDGIRQAVSLSFIFYAIQYIESKRFWKYITFIILATLFHYSSLIMLPMYFFLNNKFSTKSLYVILSVGLFFYVARISTIGAGIEVLLEKIDNPLIIKIYQYLSSSKELSDSISPKVFAHVILFFLFLKRREKLLDKNRFSNIFLNMFLIHIIMGEYFWNTGFLVVRFQHYFILGLIILLPVYIQTFCRLSNKIALVILASLMSVFISFSIFFGKIVCYVPYQNFLIYKILEKPSTGEKRLNEHLQKVLDGS